MNKRCVLCGHEIHDHCGTFLPGGHSRPPGYMCDCCEAPDADTSDTDTDTKQKRFFLPCTEAAVAALMSY